MIAMWQSQDFVMTTPRVANVKSLVLWQDKVVALPLY